MKKDRQNAVTHEQMICISCGPQHSISAAQLEGLVFEPSAAITIAALPALRKQGLVASDERIVVVATGHGLKDLSHVDINLDRAIAPTLTTMLECLSN